MNDQPAILANAAAKHLFDQPMVAGPWSVARRRAIEDRGPSSINLAYWGGAATLGAALWTIALRLI